MTTDINPRLIDGEPTCSGEECPYIRIDDSCANTGDLCDPVCEVPLSRLRRLLAEAREECEDLRCLICDAADASETVDHYEGTRALRTKRDQLLKENGGMYPRRLAALRASADEKKRG